MSTNALVSEAEGAADLAAVRELMLAYARSLDFDTCFEDFDVELDGLPGAYAPPAGGLWLARRDGRAVGVVALRLLTMPGACEMKRLYVDPDARGLGLGRRLAGACIAGARERGCRRLLLDTLPSMAAARRLYAGFGFVPTAPYNDSPYPGVRHFALDLAGEGASGG